MYYDKIIVSVDGGTTKVCTSVVRLAPDGSLELLGYGLVNSRGFRKGTVVDLEQAQEVLQESLRDARLSSGVHITDAYMGITGSQMKSMVAHGETLLRAHTGISRADLARVEKTSRSALNGSAGEIIHTIPLQYSLDGHPTQDTVIGMQGARLEVATHYISSPATLVWNLLEAASGAGLQVHGLVAESIASGEAVLTEEEKQQGVAVLDIGGGTTDIAVFYEGKPVYTAVLPVGGWQLTNDIAIGLNTPATTAEEVKIRRGEIYPSSQEAFRIPAFGQRREREVLPMEVSRLVWERMAEILQYAIQSLERAPHRYPLSAGLVFTGGTSQIEGLERLVQEVLGMPSRVGRPTGIRGLPQDLDGPAYATSLGIPLWVAREQYMATATHEKGREGSGIGTLFTRARQWFEKVSKSI